MADDDVETSADEMSQTVDRLQAKTDSLAISAKGLSHAMTSAFTQSAIGGRQLDDVLKSLALRMSNMAVSQAFKPLASGLAGGLDKLFSGLFGGGAGASIKAATGAIKPFATGGVIGTPTYFPLSGGGLGLAGEAGPEAIMPLSRGSDGRLGVAAGGGRASTSINVHIATPDAESFRRSEAYITGQIARAVARGQRSL
jgi:phage-related minor tail protein